MDRKNEPEHIRQIMGRMKIGGRPIVPDSPQGACSLCGTDTTHADSIVVDKDREHFSCREKTRSVEISLLVLEQDYLHAARTLAEDEVLFRRLDARLQPYLDKPSKEKLCRMVTFCLAEIAKDPSIRAAKKDFLSTLLQDIRKRYLPTTN